MRIATLFSTAVIGLSAAAIAQVTTTPIEQKGHLGNTMGNDMAPAADAPAGNAADASANDSAVANSTAGDPTTASDAPPK